jgi:glycerophosphoryl diester phosphodiesterase
VKIWINSLWPSLNGGHHDDRAVLENDPDGSWGWMLDVGAELIQTDRIPQLIQYLENKGCRNNPYWWERR